MKFKPRWVLVGLFFLASGCAWMAPLPVPPDDGRVATPLQETPAFQDEDIGQSSTPGRLVISELIPGVQGNNNYEFIELYNAGTQPLNLQDWSLWYRMAESQEEKLVYTWSVRNDVPGYGHYLLVREGQDIGVAPDAVFSTPIFERKGGLILRNTAGQAVDALGWGSAPADYFEGEPAPDPGGAGSLERKPGGAAGNGVDTDNNAADFTMLAEPDPQSRASAITPLPVERLEIGIEPPASVSPGTEFEMGITVINKTGAAARDVRIFLPLPAGFDVVKLPPQVEALDEGGLKSITWDAGTLGIGEEAHTLVNLRSPWSYGVIPIVGHYVESPDFPLRTYGTALPIAVEGGAIPIATARTLTGQIVTVEGVATMYTGGYFAGSTGTKFYIDDGTGGIQVYCPGAMGIISIDIGDSVRVTGLIELYRNSVELIPGVYPDHVEILQNNVDPPASMSSTGKAANSNEDIVGRLITVEGQVTRLEEYSYSYEMDLMDASGDSVLVYLDKESLIDPDFIEVGKLYQMTGILDLYNDLWQLKPRLVSDFVEVFPEVLMLEMRAQNSIAAADLITYTITAYNHTPAVLQNVTITATIPGTPAILSDIPDGGSQVGANIVWVLPELAPSGGSTAVHFSVRAGGQDRVDMAPATASADDYPDVATSDLWMTFVGSGVPIWAIQGEGFESPFVRSEVTTEGIVTGVFPDLQGFWIQSLAPDENPATSEGLYVFSPEDAMPVTAGDYVRVKGSIREKSGQTQLSLLDVADLTVINSGISLPEARELDPPMESDLSKVYYEALEGMLVQVTEQAVAIAPVSPYGEYVLVNKSWNIDRVMRGEPKGMMIFVDDGSDITHYDGSTIAYPVKTGDLVGELMGPLAYTYENYKVQPITMPVVIPAVSPLPSLAPLSGSEFSIATFNTENFFDAIDPHPTDPPRPTISAYRSALAKTAETIVAMGMPTIIGFQEVENIEVLEDLAEQTLIAAYRYAPVLVEGTDSRGIDVGYLVRGDQAQVLSVTQYPAPEGLTSRPPLVIEVELQNALGGAVIYIVNNHFLSMSAGELATEPQRNAQAAWNVTLYETILAEAPDAYIAVIGDLNSFYDAPPIDTLRKSGLQHVYEFLGSAAQAMYTYIYQGESETLDHILVSPSLFGALKRVSVLHTNADYPPGDPEDTSPQRASDHDPLVAVFNLD